MNKVLLIENNETLEFVYKINLKAYLNLDPFVVKDSNSIIETINSHSDLKLIITKASFENENVALKIVNHLKKNNLKIPLMVIGNIIAGMEEIQEYATIMSTAVDLKGLIKSCGKLICVTAKDMMNVEVPEYYPIPSNLFNSVSTSICDIYAPQTSITSKNSSSFEKLFNPGEDFTKDIIEKWIEKKGLVFFVPRDSRLKVVNQLTSEMINALSKNELSDTDRIMSGQIIMEEVSNLMSEVGVTLETINLAKTSMKNLLNTTENALNINDLIKNISANKSSYVFKHTQVLTYILLHLVRNLDWGKKIDADRISFVAFFHDILLNTDEMAKIKTNLDLQSSKLGQRERDIVLNHAVKSVELVKSFPKAPLGVEPMLTQHHGSLNGVGFPQSYSINLAPPVIAFIIAEEYADQILEAGTKKINKTFIINHLHKKFPTQRLKKIIDILEKITF